MKKYCLFVFVLLFSFKSYSQEFELPPDVQLKSKDDYAKYENALIGAANWLENTDLNVQKDKRKDLSAFVVQYVSGSPTVTIEINGTVIDLYGKNVDLLTIFLGSYTRFALENKQADKYECNKAAIKAMIKVYSKGIDVKKSKELEKIKEYDDDQLDKYVHDKFK